MQDKEQKIYISESRHKKNKNKNKNKTVKANAKVNVNAKTNPILQLIPTKKQILENYIDSFKELGIQVLEQLNENQLSDILEVSNKNYYNNIPLLTDNEYDIVKEFMEHKFPKNAALSNIGAPVEKNKVKLPYEMPSMDKIKPDTNALTQWLKHFTGPYVLSCKLDGVSALYTTECNIPKLYTRGDGKVGQDISHLIPYLKLPDNKDIVVRGELIITKNDFDNHLKDSFANPRNLVSGIVNQKKIDENIKYLHFVAYELIQPELIPSEQLYFLQTLDINIDVVLFKSIDHLTNDLLSELLIKWRKEYIFEMDGIIVTDDKLYSRKSGNPEHSFAFKMVLSEQIAEAKVVDVIWSASKDGYLKPRVRIEPIHLGGVTIEYATGFNGAFIENNKVGIGSLVEIIRSGDVIPHIKSVIQPAEKAKMPMIPYVWNNTHIDILLEDIENDSTVKEKNIAGFFKGIGVDGLSSGNIRRIIDAGYLTVPEILNMNESDFLKVEGFKQKLAHKIYSGIRDKLKNASLVQLMVCSNIFGRGLSEKKIEVIMEELPDILLSNISTSEKIKEVSKIRGMASKSAENFVDKIEAFKIFLNEIGLMHKLLDADDEDVESSSEKVKKVKEVKDANPLYKKNIVMTGARNKELIDKLKEISVNIATTVNKNTFALIAKDKTDSSTKIEDATKLNIPIFSIEEFKKIYF